MQAVEGSFEYGGCHPVSSDLMWLSNILYVCLNVCSTVSCKMISKLVTDKFK